MNSRLPIKILPYSLVVGQEELKLALELSYIAPGTAGVLISGQRGTAKSTAVRGFAMMLYGTLPVTLPINATDDRVVGGWDVAKVLAGSDDVQMGLLKEAAQKGMLYIDEVNLLDDHIVNLILDVSSTGWLSVQREGLDIEEYLAFSLVGTMNPEEGGLRPQLLDRFGLMVKVDAEYDPDKRRQVLETVLEFDRVRAGQSSKLIEKGLQQDQDRKALLEKARARLYEVKVPTPVIQKCADLASHFKVAGHRADYVMALAARADAALDGAEQVEIRHVQAVASLALQHRRPEVAQGGIADWTDEDKAATAKLLSDE